MKKGLLFDFNGTMFFDSPRHKEAWDVFSQKYRHKPMTDEELDHCHGQTNKNIIATLMGAMSDEESTQLSRAKEALYRECCLQHPDDFHLVDGLPEVLDTLKEMGVPMTICSASIKDNMDFFISSFHLDRWFDVDKIIYDDGTHVNKVSMFQDGAKAIGVDIHDCVIIEDSLSGLKFANDCGVAKIIAITTPDKQEEYTRIPGVSEIIYDYRNFDTSYFSNENK